MLASVRVLLVPLLLLLTCTVALIVGWFLVSDTDVRNFCLSLGTCFLSSLIVIIFVDRYITYKNMLDEKLRRDACLRTLAPALLKVSACYFNLWKATSTQKGEDGWVAVDLVLDSLNFDAIAEIDGSSKAPIFPDCTWTEYYYGLHAELSKTVGSFIERYAIFFDGSTIVALDKLSSPAAFQMAGTIMALGKGGGLFAIFAARRGEPSFLDEYISNFRAVLNLVAAASEEPLKVPANWAESVEPQLGSALRTRSSQDVLQG